MSISSGGGSLANFGCCLLSHGAIAATLLGPLLLQLLLLPIDLLAELGSASLVLHDLLVEVGALPVLDLILMLLVHLLLLGVEPLLGCVRWRVCRQVPAAVPMTHLYVLLVCARDKKRDVSMV